jgi:sulfate transport system ATP-binding protein
MSFIGPVNVLPNNSQLVRNFGFEKNPQDVFVRPHDIVIETRKIEGSVPAKISRLIHLGWEIIAELTFEDGHTVTATITREEYDKLKLEAQQKVFVLPKDARAFPLQYSA